MYIQPQVLHISSVISGDSKRCFFMNFWPLITTDHWHQAVDVWKPRFCAVELSLEIWRSRWTGSGWMGMVVFVPLEAVANEKVGFLHAIVFQLWLRISDIFLDIGDCANLVVDTMPFVKLTIWHRPRPLPTGRLLSVSNARSSSVVLKDLGCAESGAGWLLADYIEINATTPLNVGFIWVPPFLQVFVGFLPLVVERLITRV